MRFYKYYSVKHLQETGNKSSICGALFKYGYSNFCLHLEVCDINMCLKREQYYIDLLKPDYNILKIAGSSRGYKHNEQAQRKFAKRVVTDETRNSLLLAAKDRVLTSEVKNKISMSRLGKNLPLKYVK